MIFSIGDESFGIVVIPLQVARGGSLNTTSIQVLEKMTPSNIIITYLNLDCDGSTTLGGRRLLR